ncbi:MAG: MFS transporter [Acidobacteria bacterium]|nr:MFS transporter [Acidobacteriota bacterium]MBU4308160.1 MFS transporter [Acidobacteriota bacterium]MBU4404641.1 MFS transporter [Acidobacteriota bacterium]MCG2812849.1 MFS transporter [Candidatus Aminicenantes bacterium]
MEDVSEQRVALLVTTLSSLLTPMMSSAVNIAMPAIARDFAMDAVLLSWVASSYLLAAAIFLLPFGRLADIVGRKKIFVYGTVIFSSAALLAGLAPRANLFLFARLVQGIGAAMIFGTGIAILTSVYPPQRRGWVLGINVAATYTGLSLGPFVGGLLTQYLGWRWVFLLNVPLGMLILIAVWLKMPQEWAGSRGEPFDWKGSLAYSLMLTAFMLGFTWLPRWKGLVLLLAAAGALPLFMNWEARHKHPIFQARLIRGNTVFAFSNLAALINYSATFAITFLLSLYLQYIKGFDPRAAGLVLIAQPVVMAAFSPLAGRLSDRLEPRLVASLGMGVSAAGLFLFVWLNAHSGLGFIVAALMLVGFGFALFSSPNTNAIMSSVDKKYYGVASATLATMRMVGQMLSMGIATLVFSLFIGNVQITPAIYPLFLNSIRVSFIVFFVLCCCGVFFSLARGRLR